MQFFVDKCLPFGSSISCSHFQRFSNALKHITEFQIGHKDSITNYLDDFLFVAPDKATCNAMVSSFIDICNQLGVPVAHEKTEFATTKILLNGVSFTLALPDDKLSKAVAWIQEILSKKKTTLKNLEQLVGLLNFFNRAIVPGRAFTRRIYSKFSSLQVKLKSYHHLKVDSELKKDLQIWLQFLTRDSTFPISLLARPYIDLKKDSSNTNHSCCLNFTSDATAAKNLDFGCVYDDAWTYQRWEPNFIKSRSPSIEFLELYALCQAVFIWAPKLMGIRALIYCENEAVTHMVNNQTSGCKYCMVLIRKLVLKSLHYNFRLTVRYISSKDNFLSDSLSRLKVELFRWQATTIGLFPAEKPTPLSQELWPLSALWDEHCKPLN